MSLKDRLRFNGFPLPPPGAADVEYAVEGIEGVEDHLEVRSDGTLWRDRNSPFWSDDPSGAQPAWERDDLTGELLVVHVLAGDSDPLRWSLYFLDGQLREIHRVDSRRRRAVEPKE